MRCDNFNLYTYSLYKYKFYQLETVVMDRAVHVQSQLEVNFFISSSGSYRDKNQFSGRKVFWKT